MKTFLFAVILGVSALCLGNSQAVAQKITTTGVPQIIENRTSGDYRLDLWYMWVVPDVPSNNNYYVLMYKKPWETNWTKAYDVDLRSASYPSTNQGGSRYYGFLMSITGLQPGTTYEVGFAYYSNPQSVSNPSTFRTWDI